MKSSEIEILTRRLIPCPESLNFKDGTEFYLKDKCPVTVEIGTKTGIRQKIIHVCKQYWDLTPVLSLQESAAAKKCEPEAYLLNITENQLKITARDWQGVANAFKTLRQLAEPIRGTEEVTGYILVPCKIKDKPAMPFRGIHICIFPETPLWDVEKQIRLAAYYKFNYAVIECWGVFPFESHPAFCWKDHKLDKMELKRLIRLGKELGITLVPQFNLLGHAAGARSITGKHAILDFDSSLQPLFEPEGWSWCLTNPVTRKILTDLVSELHDFFENPPFFHIGCDEAHDAGSCFECRKHKLKNLIHDHILYFHDLFKKRKTRLIMWHDMLLEMNDKRWEGYIAFAEPVHGLATLYRDLPKDIVIADWQYYFPRKEGETEPSWPTAKFFKKEKFSVLVCPWKDVHGTESLGKLAAKEKLMGMLETTWHISHGREFLDTYAVAACSAWNPKKVHIYGHMLFVTFGLHLRQIAWDMDLSDYKQVGTSQYQVDPGHHPHRLI